MRATFQIGRVEFRCLLIDFFLHVKQEWQDYRHTEQYRDFRVSIAERFPCIDKLLRRCNDGPETTEEASPNTFRKGGQTWRTERKSGESIGDSFQTIVLVNSDDTQPRVQSTPPRDRDKAQSSTCGPWSTEDITESK